MPILGVARLSALTCSLFHGRIFFPTCIAQVHLPSICNLNKIVQEIEGVHGFLGDAMRRDVLLISSRYPVGRVFRLTAFHDVVSARMQGVAAPRPGCL